MMPVFGEAPPKLKPMTENSAITSGSRHDDLLRLLRHRCPVLQRSAGRGLHLDHGRELHRREIPSRDSVWLLAAATAGSLGRKIF